MIVNNIENSKCKGCKRGRDLTPEENKALDIEKQEFWDKKDELKQILSELEKELPEAEFKTCVKKLRVILGNIFDQPEEQKYKTIKLDNKKFLDTVGKFDLAMELLLFIGFEKVPNEDSKTGFALSHTSKETNMLFEFAYNKIKDFVEILKEEEEVKGVKLSEF